MDEQGRNRKLAAILAADVAGYSRLMGRDEKATVQTLIEYRQIFTRHIERHQGFVVDTAGDSILATFDSAVEAVTCAIEIQRELAWRNGQYVDDRKMLFRIGVNLGDVISRNDGTVYGDGVNIAARLESLAEPGGITVSGTIFDQIENKIPVDLKFEGDQFVKNIEKAVRAYRVGIDATTAIPKSLSSTPTSPTEPGPKRRGGMLGIALVCCIAIGLVGWYAGRSRNVQLPRSEPIVAVLAFANMSDDPKQGHFSDGLSESVIDNLAQMKALKVIARNSSFRYKGQSIDVRQIGSELGAGYVVEGSVRRSADTIRVTAQLVDSGNGAHLWSKTFDRALTVANVFEIQDEIASLIATTVAGAYGILRQEGLVVAKRKAPAELNSYECALLGTDYWRAVSISSFRAARDCAEKAVVVDPQYAPLWIALARVSRGEFQHHYDTKPGSLDRALAAAQRALALDPNNADYLSETATIHFYRGELDQFKSVAARAIERAPRGASVFGDLGLQFWYAGDWEKGLALIEQAKALDPFFAGWYHLGAFHDHYRKHLYTDALVDAQRMSSLDYVQVLSVNVAVNGQLGRVAEARRHIDRIFELDPHFDARAHWSARFRYQQDYLEHLLDGMRKAGMTISEKSN